mmetsp:Transcript_10420/g.63669  ORF Transcript_10420/g.63669 Transcript_10420/m.63669 type:complete len:202 (+) Transcript_10420:2159-2764(+)
MRVVGWTHPRGFSSIGRPLLYLSCATRIAGKLRASYDVQACTSHVRVVRDIVRVSTPREGTSKRRTNAAFLRREGESGVRACESRSQEEFRRRRRAAWHSKECVSRHERVAARRVTKRCGSSRLPNVVRDVRRWSSATSSWTCERNETFVTCAFESTCTCCLVCRGRHSSARPFSCRAAPTLVFTSLLRRRPSRAGRTTAG